MLTLIIAWLALQLPFGALIGTFLERGMAQPRHREAALAVAERLSISFKLTPIWAVSISALADRDGVPARSTREQRPGDHDTDRRCAGLACWQA
jgi:hypothetical protein